LTSDPFAPDETQGVKQPLFPKARTPCRRFVVTHSSLPHIADHDRSSACITSDASRQAWRRTLPADPTDRLRAIQLGSAVRRAYSPNLDKNIRLAFVMIRSVTCHSALQPSQWSQNPGPILFRVGKIRKGTGHTNYRDHKFHVVILIAIE
jgi:hypothetical protein